MAAFRPDLFHSALKQPLNMVKSIGPFLDEIQNSNIQWTYEIIQEIANILRAHSPPLIKVNALLIATKCIELSNYAILLFAEIYLVPTLYKTIEFIISNPQLSQMTAYFEMQGYPQSTEHLGNLSYNFVVLTCQFLSLAARIKPLRVYMGREYEDLSLFNKSYEKIVSKGACIEANRTVIQRNEKPAEMFRQKFLLSLRRWSNYEDQLVFFFVQKLELYLSEDLPRHQLSFLETFRYGQSLITSEIIARLVDIMTYHMNFPVRTRAVKLLDQFVLWGDVEALLVINFTEHLPTLTKIIWKIRGQKSLDEGRNIYPQIQENANDKAEFYRELLRCVQSWAVSFPTHEYLSVNKSNSGQLSPIYLLYRLLKQKKRFIFPANPLLSKYEKDSHQAMAQKTLRNQLIIKDINSQSEGSQISVFKIHSQKELSQYYLVHRQALMQILTNSQGDIHERMSQLFEFKQNFENVIENMSTDEELDESFDNLVQNGLELIDIITAIHHPYIEFLHKEISQKEYCQAVNYICQNYLGTKERPAQRFFSERLINRKDQLISMFRKQRSNPLEHQLRNISSNSLIRQFKKKYKLRFDKMNTINNSSRSSEYSSMNLEIFTKNQFTRESREEMNNFKQTTEQNNINHRESLPTPKNVLAQSKTESLKSQNERRKIQVTAKMTNNTENQKCYNNNANIASNNNTVKGITALKLELESETQSSRQTEKGRLKNQEFHRGGIVPWSQHAQYFSFIPNESFKFSYLYNHIIVFNSPFLAVERIVVPLQFQSRSQLRIEIILIALTNICLTYSIEQQESIEMADVSPKLPPVLMSGSRFKITIIGQMKKIPIKLPSIALFRDGKCLFQYILPFTINFFLFPCVKETQTLQYFHKLCGSPNNISYYSKFLAPSQVIFPNKSLNNLHLYFPGCIRLTNVQLCIDLYIWQACYKDIMEILVIFQYSQRESLLVVRVYGIQENYNNQPFYRYITNFLSHLVGEREI